ncbi:MAG TPA: PQQ-binding-like beta-propeller repeat protein [Kofleriaceae bacterium]|jgi:outer membrane protein assembly factor BamB
MRNLATLATLATLGCGGGATFRLSQDENNSYALDGALAKDGAPAQPSPVGGGPRAYLAGNHALVAYDLAANKVAWKVPADVTSRVAVGGDFVVEREGTELVARDAGSGAVRWKHGVGNDLVGAAADHDRAYAVVKRGTDADLVAFAGGSGAELWRDHAEGGLGGPATLGSLVLVPYNSQWLSLVDGKTGAQVTRVRGVDEMISIVRSTSRVAWFGSKQGVFRLDHKAAAGKKAEASYTRVQIPALLADRASYGIDRYDAIQLGYSASDRARVLWSGGPDGPELSGGGYAIHFFRYVFGFDLDGKLRWAYANPRVELVATEATGPAILGVDTNGDLVALDAETGAVRWRGHSGLGGSVTGATFDADGWAPQGQSEPTDLIGTLAGIAKDHDARFDRVKELAARALATQSNPEVTSELLAILADKRAPQHLKDVVVELLVVRKDGASLPVLTQQLAAHDDFLAKTEADSLGVVAKAISGLGDVPIDPKAVPPALEALRFHLDAPTTSVADLTQVIAAMAAIGHGAERDALWAHLLMYHADDELGADGSWCAAIVRALDDKGPADRELLRYVAADPRTQPTLSAAIRDALGAD